MKRVAGLSDISLLALRIGTGAFLIHGVWDNIVSPARMAEFVAFLTAAGFPLPQLSAPLTVWMQLAIGIAFILGAATRLAGLLCALTFVTGIAYIHARDDLPAIWPALALVLIGFDLMVRGGGRWSADAFIARRARPTSPSAA